MPTYDYKCIVCNTVKEVWHKMSDIPTIRCDTCDTIMIKIVSGGVGTIFKGNWYKTTGTY